MSGLRLNELEYLEMRGLNVMLAHDFYPEGHQGGVGVIQNGLRVATNGDVRLEPIPGQWGAIPKVGPREIDRERQEISLRMEFPDETKHRRGFNPLDYPDLQLAYRVSVRPLEGPSFIIRAELESHAPKIGFNLEFFPGFLFGKNFCMDDAWGAFPRQPHGPSANSTLSEPAAPHLEAIDDRHMTPLAEGNKLVIAPEDERLRLTIVSASKLQLLDGRGKHNNGWFVVRSEFEERVIEWIITPHVLPEWTSEPVIQVSQVGYHPSQPKVAVIELDAHDTSQEATLVRIHKDGRREQVPCRKADDWGKFLRYRYLRLDFSEVKEPGLYEVAYAGATSNPFRIASDIFDRHVWQPTVETFLPVQMCHMRVEENYRVWHGACHLDDARMAPIDHNHFDGYVQGDSTLCPFEPGQEVSGLNVGGWHDAGDYDLRVESQADTVWGLALAYEMFDLRYDNTTIDQEKRLVQMLRPDGKPDVLQQIEHGCLSIVAGYKALGRLYRGIIEPTLKQYVHLGDAATQTDNVPSDDDRWVFTEQNAGRELSTAAALYACSRVLGEINQELATDCRRIAEALSHTPETAPLQKLALAVEMADREYILEHRNSICEKIDHVDWLAARSVALVDDQAYQEAILEALRKRQGSLEKTAESTPYGLPYTPDIWGAGWGIQRMGVRHYWLHTCCPEIFTSEYVFNALSFILGCHPGPNTASFVSGVGAKSLIPGYGVNRADWSYIPGGIGSGTALIRPDYPELLEFPYLWQQTEYCLGYPTSDFVFLVNAARALLQ